MKMTAIALLPLLLVLCGCPSRQSAPPSTPQLAPLPQPVPASPSMAEPDAEPRPQVLLDPNCQVNVVAGAAFPNRYAAMNNAQHDDATNAIAMLTFPDLYRNPPFRIQGPANLVRLDVQGAIPGGGRNWQVQVNGVAHNSTISTMLIDGGLAGASTADRQRFVERSARNALVQSLNTANTYRVTGVCN